MRIKKIALFSPVPINSKLQTGISIRINELCKWFKSNSLNTFVRDKTDSNIISEVDAVYVMVSTKPSSISSQIAKSIPSAKLLIVDLYTPIFLEKELYYSKFNPKNFLDRKKAKSSVKKILVRGNLFLVANKKQREYWLKTSKSLGVIIEPSDISAIPTGAPAPTFLKRAPNKIILWFGGIYPWLDPAPLAEAFLQIAKKYPDWKLRILGGYYQGTGYLKIYNNFLKILSLVPPDQVELIPWQKPQDLPKYLNDAAFAVHLPKSTKEDIYAHRVRLLSLTNSHIPVLTSGNDAISQAIIKENAGVRVSTNPRILASQLAVNMTNQKRISQMSKNAALIERSFLKNQSKDNILTHV